MYNPLTSKSKAQSLYDVPKSSGPSIPRVSPYMGDADDCVDCEDGQPTSAVACCENCEKRMCAKHVDIHSKLKSSRHHVVVPIAGTKQASVTKMMASLDVTLRTDGSDRQAAQNLPTHNKMKSQVSRPTVRTNPSGSSLNPLAIKKDVTEGICYFGSNPDAPEV